MKETLDQPAAWQSSVIAVPPLARTETLDLAPEANRTLIAHIERGGISIIMYGGNANFYNVAISEYEAVIDFLSETVGPDTWVIPSIGPDFGRLRDQSAILARKRFPTAMVLPTNANMTQDGLDKAIRLTADTLGAPLVLYVKEEGYLDVERIARLDRDGVVCFVKYAIVRDDPEADPFLERLIAAIGVDRIVSGIGERPAIAHFRHFGLRSFTTGSGSVAPANAMQLLSALKSGDYAAAERIRATFLPLEDLRDSLGPAYVLHEAVTLSRIADMGPILPLMSNISAQARQPVGDAAQALRALDQGLAAQIVNPPPSEP